MKTAITQRIQQFYDDSSDLWEQVWGEHMHHGYYGPTGTQKKDRRQAQIDLIEELLQWAGLQGAQNILDVGCGIGGSSLYLAQKFNATVTGITLSPVQAARAQERAAVAQLSSRERSQGAASGGPLSPKTQFQVADALNLPLADAAFDLVWALESGEHMPDKVKFLQECYRVLQPGGTLLMVTWCHRPTDEGAGSLTADEQRHLEDIYQVYCLPYVISLPEYEAIARNLCFQNIRTADWSTAVAPFWDVVIDSAFNPMAIWGLLCSGWGTIQAALSLGLMRRGYQRGLIKFGLLCASK